MREHMGHIVSLAFPIIHLCPEYPPVCSAEVGVCLWELGEYRVPDTHFPGLINPEWIAGQLALTTVSIGKDRVKVWATVELAKVRGTQLEIYLLTGYTVNTGRVRLCFCIKKSCFPLTTPAPEMMAPQQAGRPPRVLSPSRCAMR